MPHAPDRTDTAHLLVTCPDQPGIIAAVSALLRARGINIIQSAQYSTDPEGGSFYLRMVLHIRDVGGRIHVIVHGSTTVVF
jgi:formyltetrahydrofolate deformylase